MNMRTFGKIYMIKECLDLVGERKVFDKNVEIFEQSRISSEELCSLVLQEVVLRPL